MKQFLKRNFGWKVNGYVSLLHSWFCSLTVQVDSMLREIIGGHQIGVQAMNSGAVNRCKYWE
jgi:hypothetical protein